MTNQEIAHLVAKFINTVQHRRQLDNTLERMTSKELKMKIHALTDEGLIHIPIGHMNKARMVSIISQHVFGVTFAQFEKDLKALGIDSELLIQVQRFGAIG